MPSWALARPRDVPHGRTDGPSVMAWPAAQLSGPTSAGTGQLRGFLLRPARVVESAGRAPPTNGNELAAAATAMADRRPPTAACCRAGRCALEGALLGAFVRWSSERTSCAAAAAAAASAAATAQCAQTVAETTLQIRFTSQENG